MNHAAVILAAGRGTRYRAAGGGEPSKLIAHLDGRPLVRHVAEAALASRAAPVVVVLGHAAAEVAAALAGLPVAPVANPAFAEGLSTSLKAGLAALPASCRGAVLLLGDMPHVDRATIDALMARAESDAAADAVVPVHDGQWGNPILLSRGLFARCAALSGDRGARPILKDPTLRIATVAAPPSVLDDIDLPGDLA